MLGKKEKEDLLWLGLKSAVRKRDIERSRAYLDMIIKVSEDKRVEIKE